MVAFELPTFAHTCSIVQCEMGIFPCTIHYIPVRSVIRFTLLASEAEKFSSPRHGTHLQSRRQSRL